MNEYSNAYQPASTASASSSGGVFTSSRLPDAKVWRVGSLSMGITLMLIGMAFAVSLWQDVEAYKLLLWVTPVVFILLGAELLIYLAVAGKGERLVRYDWVSVFFVGVIGAGSLVLALLMSTGLYEELKRDIQTTNRTAFVDTIAVEVPETVERVIVHSLSPVTIEEMAATRKLHLMGQVPYRAEKPLTIPGSSLMKTEVIGSDLYVFIGTPEWRGGDPVDHSMPHLILSIPEEIVVEQRPI